VDHLLEHIGRDGEAGHQGLVHHADAVLPEGTQAELGLTGVSELADDDDVERAVEDPSHLGGHRDPAAGHADDDGPGRSRKRFEKTGQPATGVGPVDEEGAGPPGGRSEIGAAGGHERRSQGLRVRVDGA
jgi:hypothetical protein